MTSLPVGCIFGNRIYKTSKINSYEIFHKSTLSVVSRELGCGGDCRPSGDCSALIACMQRVDANTLMNAFFDLEKTSGGKMFRIFFICLYCFFLQLPFCRRKVIPWGG